MSFQTLFDRFAQLRVLVVGDAMIDRYIYGTVTRISPEAPVPIVLKQRTEEHPGGAANVALNLRALGAEVHLVSVVGTDDAGDLVRLLSSNGIGHQSLVLDKDRPTTIKTRIMAGKQQLLRIDSETNSPISEDIEAALLAKIAKLAQKGCDAIILQDYNKGVLTENIIGGTMDLARQLGCLTAVDPKFDNFFSYTGATLFKPNLKETRDALKINIMPNEHDLAKVSSQLRDKIRCQNVMITLSELGIFYDDDIQNGILPTQARHIADVSGAGDTVISVATLALAAGLQMRDVAHIANMAASLVCKSPGVVAVDRAELFHTLTINQS